MYLFDSTVGGRQGKSWPTGWSVDAAKVAWAVLDWGDRSSLFKVPPPHCPWPTTATEGSQN